MRNRLATLSVALLAAATLSATASAQGTLRVAMTSADVPTTGGIPNNGGEGNRFLGFTAYDALINWELAKNLDGIAGVRPGLAAKWWIDEKDRTKWVFKLRQGVKFHDGTPLTVDAVIFNLGRIFDEKAPQFDAPASPIVRSQISMLDRWEKIDDETRGSDRSGSGVGSAAEARRVDGATTAADCRG